MRTVMVTGAAGGLGKVLVQRIHDRGDLVVPAARALSALTDLVGERFLPIAMDVADTGSVANGFAAMDALLAGRTINAVVHCAAVAPLGTVEFTTPDEYARILNINTLGALRVAQESLRRMRGKDGRLILVSSLWGQVSGPLVSAYSASKHGVEAIADALRRETAGSGMAISVVVPGVVKTKMFTGQAGDVDARIAALNGTERAYYLSLYEAYSKVLKNSARTALTAEACADAIIRVLDARRPPTRCRVGTDAKMLIGLAKWLPDRGLDMLFGKMFRTG